MDRTVAQVVAERLVAQRVARVYGLCGGHVQPFWDAIARAGISIVDVRHESAAVYMAQAESELTGGLGVAIVTAGPGLTNAVTAISNAMVSRSSVLVLSGRPPRPQAGMGALQDIPQAAIVAPVCRCVEQISERGHVLPRMDKVIGAALGWTGEGTGPAYIDFATDLLDEPVHPVDAPPQAFRPRDGVEIAPTPDAVRAARTLLQRSGRIVAIGGRAVRAAGPQLRSFLEATGALYLDTGECRGAVRDDHPGYVPAMRARVMREADLVVTLGRRLDFQLAYGSTAAFSPEASFLRIGTCFEETGENRRGDVEVTATVKVALDALVRAGAAPADPDTSWLAEIKHANARRVARLRDDLDNPQVGADGRMHPYYLINAVNRRLTRRSVVVADGGDILSFARVGIRPVDYLDCGAFGCLGIGVPFAISAALQRPSAPVIAIIGDGSFGFTAMEIDTAVRHDARALFVVANNEAWNIERRDQVNRYDNLVGVELPGCRYDLLGRGLGAYAERVEKPADLDPALDRALDNTPAVLDVLVSRDATSPDSDNGLARVPSRQAIAAWDLAEQARYEPTP